MLADDPAFPGRNADLHIDVPRLWRQERQTVERIDEAADNLGILASPCDSNPGFGRVSLEDLSTIFLVELRADLQEKCTRIGPEDAANTVAAYEMTRTIPLFSKASNERGFAAARLANDDQMPAVRAIPQLLNLGLEP